ncbi:hypothetical protein JCM10908_003139 [Rhodotorula pacifica]|uniref:uncharacterized protein n=1 Tax=Rhodotorula pacifica TaxID=1495444 RepID=UPI00317F0A35
MASFNVASLMPDIERILQRADRSSVSAKAVRKALQEKYPGLDVKAHKAEIDALTTDIFTAGASGEEDEDVDVKPTVTSPKTKLPSFHKIKRARSPSSTVEGGSDALPASSPAFALASTSAPRIKQEKPALTDEEVARKLQAEFASEMTTGRATRNGGAGAATKKRAIKTKKKKAGSYDDDEDGADKKKKKRKTSHTGFNKLHILSADMAEICGAPALSRPGVTKALWKYIKANELQDPNKRTDILPDATLKKVIPVDRVNSFTMAKYVSPHLYPFDEVEHAHLAPPLDPVSDDFDGDDRKPKKERGTSAGASTSIGVQRANGRTKSAAEVDSEDDDSF